MTRHPMRLAIALWVLLGSLPVAHGQPPAATAVPQAGSSATSAAEAAGDEGTDKDQDQDQDDAFDSHKVRARHHHRTGWDEARGSDLVGIGHDSNLPAGQRADSVVSVLGSSTSAGDSEDVVSVVGNTRVTGTAQGDAVSIMGSTDIDGKVEGDAVAVFGDVTLGPHAVVDGDVVAVFGAVQRDPGAIVHGAEHSMLGGMFGPVTWLQAWIKRCLLFGRPLALASDIGWAWGLALGFLAFYACLALLFPAGINRCAATLQQHPGHSLLASLIAMLLSPMLIVLLCVTLIGIAAVPFVATALVCAALFGRAVVLAWIGTRIMASAGSDPANAPAHHPALAVLVGGAVVLVLYLIPVLGFVVYQVVGILGLGAVVYTLVVAARERQPVTAPATVASLGAEGAVPSGFAASGTVPPDAATHGAASPGAASPGAASPGATALGGAAGAGPSAAPPPGIASPPVTAALPRAGFWIRMVALLLDVLLVGFVMEVLHHEHGLQLIVLAVYGAVMWKLRGSTVGGIIFDLRVVRLDGRPVDWETAIVRALGCFLSLVVAGLGFIWIVFDRDNQAWHDKIAGTVVVRVPRAAPLV